MKLKVIAGAVINAVSAATETASPTPVMIPAILSDNNIFPINALRKSKTKRIKTNFNTRRVLYCPCSPDLRPLLVEKDQIAERTDPNNHKRGVNTKFGNEFLIGDLLLYSKKTTDQVLNLPRSATVAPQACPLEHSPMMCPSLALQNLSTARIVLR